MKRQAGRPQDLLDIAQLQDIKKRAEESYEFGDRP
jgi:hypothetical protein